MDESGTQVVWPKPPLGMYSGKVDDKGRLKVPVKFQGFFSSLPEETLFVTSLDRRIGQIYPVSLWRENVELEGKLKGDREVARKAMFNAQDLGVESEMDAQGRIQLPPELRRELNIENQTVRLRAVGPRVEILSEPVYQDQRRQSGVTPEELDRLADQGWK